MIAEYLGEEEKSLIDYILTQVKTRTLPEEIFKQLKPVFDEEAETFILKMWRRLLYEVLTVTSK